jgi:hypothetical protein
MQWWFTAIPAEAARGRTGEIAGLEMIDRQLA